MEGSVSAGVEHKNHQTTITDFFKPVEQEEIVLNDDDPEAWETEEEEEDDPNDDDPEAGETEDEHNSDECSCSSCSPSDGWEIDDEIVGGRGIYEDMLSDWAAEERQRRHRSRQWTLIEIYGWDQARKVDPEAFSAMYYKRAFGYGFEQARRAEQQAGAFDTHI